MSSRGHMRGLFAIPVTPFDEQGVIDEPSLHGVMGFCVEAGADGIVTPVNVSEFTTLSRQERQLVTRVAVAEAAGHVPVVIGVGAESTAESVWLSRDAQEAGANAIISMPPVGAGLDEAGIHAFYSALAKAVTLPIFIQNHEGPVGTPMSGAFLARLCNEIDNVRYIKEESNNTGSNIVETLRLAPTTCEGIMGGKAGRYLLDEFRRGTCGTMPACESADIHAQLWRALDQGKEGEARQLFKELLPLLNLEALYSTAVYKEVLFRRGIIRTPFKRLPGRALDAFDHLELDRVLDDLAPFFTVKTPWRRSN
jgi:4-hydroxy-tetrahydrodipicolinate synthase